MKRNLARHTVRVLLAAAAAGTLVACQSVDSLQSILEGNSSSQPAPAAETTPPAPEIREQRPAGAASEPQATTSSDGITRNQQQSVTAGGETTTAAPQQQAAAPQQEEQAATSGEPQASQTAVTAPAAGETQTAETGATDEPAAASGEDPGRRVAEAPKSGGFGGELSRRVEDLFSSGTTTQLAKEAIQENEVTGSWVMEEEDGLRTCQISLTSRESGAVVQPAGECSGLGATVTRWSIFGSDLLLSKADNTVVARLRQDAGQWIGFTLGTGIPVVLTRPSAASG